MIAAASHPKREAIQHLLGDEPDILQRVLAIMESAASAEHQAVQQPGPIQLQLTLTIQRNYVRRKVFERFHPEHAAKMLPNLTAIFYVSVDDAEEVVKDAREQKSKYDGPRGETVAWSALIRCLARSIEDEKFRDCVEFPGAEKVDAELRAASAILKIGTRVTIWDGDEQIGQGSIMGEYRDRLVTCPDGPYLNKGERVMYRHGYSVIQGDEIYFYPPHQLAPIGESYGHLRLVR